MPITSVNEVKAMMNISGSSKDAQIAALLPAVTAYIEKYCKSDFVSGSLNTFTGEWEKSSEQVYPEGLKFVAARMIDYEINRQSKGNVTSEGIGAYSVGYNTSYPQELIDLLKSFRHVKFG